MTGTIATATITHAVTSTEVKQACHFLQQTEAALAAWTDALSEPQWHYKPVPGQWSITGILEHCAMVQQDILGRIRAQLAAAPLCPNPEAAADEDMLTRSEDRSVTVEAPEFVHPTGSLTPKEAWESLRLSNAELLNWLETATVPAAVLHTGTSVDVLSGRKYELMDGYEWVLGAAGHLARHACQIFQIRDCPSFPAA